MIKKSCALLPPKSIRRIIALIMCLPVLLSAVCFPAVAAQNNIKTVKAGIFSFDGYHMLDENGVYTGYGIDFLNMVSQYSSLNFEYIGFDRPWNDMLAMLENGEIDVLTSARKTPDREEKFAFSAPIGRNDTVLSVRNDSSHLYAGDYRSYNGITIGLVKGSSQNKRLEDFAKDKGFSYKGVEFENSQQMTEALRNASVDAILSSNLRRTDSEKTLDIIYSDNFYAIVRKGNTELLNEINYAIEQMNINKGDWSNNLFYKYYSHNYSYALDFTEREKEYIRQVVSGEKTITVTSIGDRKPYSYFENGTLNGILPDFFAEVMKIAGLPYQTVIPETREDYYQMANNNYVDVVIDKQTDISETVRSDNGFFTDAYMTTSVSRITKKNFSGEIKKIAITDLQNDAFIEQALTKDSETIHFETREEAMRAVADGKADAAYAYTYTAQSFISNNNLENELSFTIISGHRYAFRMYIRNTSDHELVTILDKCIKQLSEDTVNQLISKYTTYTPENISFNSYLRMHPAFSILISIAFVLLVSSVALIILRFSYSNRLLEEKEKTNASMERQLNIVNALSRDYLNVYSININNKTLRIIKIEGYVTSTLESPDDEYSYDYIISNYIKERVYEEDQEYLVNAMRLENVMLELEIKPEYSGTYRINTDNELHTIQFVYIDMTDKKKNKPRWRNEHFVIVGFRNIDDMIRNEQKQQEILTKALAEAQHANIAKTTFLNNMSHDIRTPMNAIIGFTSLAATHIENREKVLDYLDKVLVSSKHLLSLINDVLDMSRIESGKVKIEEDETSLPEIIHSLKTIVQSDIKAKQLEFFIDTVDVTNEIVICDKLRLSQVLLNILSNAMKYTKPGGKVSARIIQTEAEKDGSASYEFRIKDSGIGMSKEFLEHLFEPFERERTATVSGIQGTGLGLAITKNIVDMMNGIITVESEVGVGTEFIVSFVFRTVKNTLDNKYIDKLSKLHALVVNDDVNTCTSVSRMLSGIGMRSEWTTLGKEAVIRAQFAMEQGDPFSVFIIDWLIPDMNGIETARRIHRVIGDDVPIIILTAYDWSDIEEEARAAGITAFCSKPIFLSELQEVLTAPYRTAEEQENSEPLNESEPDTLSGKNILLVEDNELNREIAKTVLEEYGIIVYTADNGQEAVEQVEQNPGDTFSVILMDIQMPVMDGYQASREIRAMDDKTKSSLPIIAMTANAFEEDKQKAAEAGMNGHVAKPIDIPVLLETLKDILK